MSKAVVGKRPFTSSGYATNKRYKTATGRKMATAIGIRQVVGVGAQAGCYRRWLSAS